MILFSHKSKYFIWVGFLYFIFPLLCISFFADTQDLWFKNIFSDKTFVMLIIACICAWCCHNRFFYQSSYYGTYKK